MLAALSDLAISIFRLLRVQNVSCLTQRMHAQPQQTAALVAT